MTTAQERLQGFSRDATKKKAAQLAVSVVEFQKATLGNSINLLGKAQEQSNRILRDLLKNASWVPSEGREVLDEWNETMKRAREDFKITSDRSFDLIVQYLDRVQAGEGKSVAPAQAKTKPAPKKPAPRKLASKNVAPKSVAAKPATKEATEPKPAAAAPSPASKKKTASAKPKKKSPAKKPVAKKKSTAKKPAAKKKTP